MSTDVPVLAVTATVTKPTFDCVVRRLSMENVCVIGLTPNHDNIHLSVTSNISLNKFIQPIAISLKHQGKNYLKTIIFCRSYADCNEVYDELARSLGPYLTFPPGCPNTCRYRMVDLFMRGSKDQAKEEVLQEYVKVDTHLHLKQLCIWHGY